MEKAAEEEIYNIKVLYANLTRITEAKQDPYCVLQLAEQKFQTKVQENTPTKPIWNETFILNRIEKTTKLKVQIWDWDSPTKSDIIGEGEYDLKPIKLNEKKSLSVEISYKAKKAGMVFFEIERTVKKKPEIPEKSPVSVIKKKLLSEKVVKEYNEDYEKLLMNFKKIDLNSFTIETKVAKALHEGLIIMGQKKPGNPVNFLGNFLVNYQEK